MIKRKKGVIPTLLDAYFTKLSEPGCLGIEGIWGYPNNGRPEIELPAFALLYGKTAGLMPDRRIGGVIVWGTSGNDVIRGGIPPAAPTIESIAGEVWAAGSRTLTSFGSLVSDIWANATRSLTDKAGFSLSSAGVHAIWDALTSALTSAGSIGKLLVDMIDATISSRLSTGSYTAPDNATIAAIQADTNDLQTQIGTAGSGLTAIGDTRIGNLDATISSRSTLTSGQVNSEVDTALSDYGALRPTVAGRTLDVNAAGEAGLDLDNTSGSLAKGTEITGFNDLSASQVNAEADAALSDAGLTTTVTGRIDAAISSRASETLLQEVSEDVLAILDDTGVSGVVISSTLMRQIADEILKRAVSNVEGTPVTGTLAELILSVFESEIDGTTWTIRKTTGETFSTRTVTKDPNADLITGVT